MTNRKAFTVETNENLSGMFTKQALERGFTKYRAIEGSLRCWLALPKEVQVSLMELQNDEIMPVDKLFESIDLKLFRKRVQQVVADLGLRLEKSRPSQRKNV